MSERVIHIGTDVVALTTSHKQLVARCANGETVSAPCEDLGVVVVDHNPALTMSVGALQRLTEAGTAVIFCDQRHHPASTLTPLHGISRTPEVLSAQTAMSLPRRKRAWQQVVQAKIRFQAANLEDSPSVQRRLERLTAKVRSGDPDNIEAQAARAYWQALLAGKGRDAGSRVGLNGALDYGYALIRAVLARSVAGAGLTTALGIHHHSATNPFNLVDDLIEPLRPQLDRYVFDNLSDLDDALQPHHKQTLLGFLTCPFTFDYETSLIDACDAYARHVRSYAHGETDRLAFPRRADIT